MIVASLGGGFLPLNHPGFESLLMGGCLPFKRGIFETLEGDF